MNIILTLVVKLINPYHIRLRYSLLMGFYYLQSVPHDDHTLYISDVDNDHVMKWMRDAKEGIIVAGGNGKEDRFIQLSSALRLIVDQCGEIYIADWDNRVMRWCEEEKQERIVPGDNCQGQEENQLNSFHFCHRWRDQRIEKFERSFALERHKKTIDERVKEA